MAIYNEFGNLKNLDSSFGDLAKNALNKRDKFDKRNVRYDRQKQITRDILGIELYQFLCKNAHRILLSIAKKAKFSDFTGTLRYSYKALVFVDNPNYPTRSFSIGKDQLSPIRLTGYIRSTKKTWARFKINKFNKNGKQRVVRRKHYPRFAYRQSGSTETRIIDKVKGVDENSYGGTRQYNSYIVKKNKDKRYLKYWEQTFPYELKPQLYRKIGKNTRSNNIYAHLVIVNTDPVSSFSNMRHRIFNTRRGSDLITNKDMKELKMAIGSVSSRILKKNLRDISYYNNKKK